MTYRPIVPIGFGRPFPYVARRARPAVCSNDRLAQWNCGSDGWAMTPSGMRGVLNDAVSIYFADATLARAFVAGGCARSKAETAGVCSTCARMSRRRGSGPGCIARPDVGMSVC
jgi:hypothetical protein